MSPGVSSVPANMLPEHHRVAAEEQRLEDGAVALDAAVGDERHAVSPAACAALDQRLQLRHAEAGGQPRRAAAAGADADLDGVDAALGEKPHAFGRRDVAGDQLDVGEALAERVDRAGHHHRVAVRDVDHDHVDAAPSRSSAARSR